MKVIVQAQIAAPVADVWKAWTTPEDIVQWNTASFDWHTTASTVDLRVGGKFSSRMEAKDGSAGFDFEGTYIEIVPHELIEAEFGGRTLIVEFEPTEKGTLIRETFDAEDTYSPEQQREGWQAILDNFAIYVESKKPLAA